ncbi:MAG: outer membrane protein assembly factor BamB family protein [Limisphaerales bacterium]
MISSRGRVLLSIGAVLSALTVGAAAEENWGQWRGPLGNGVGPKADPPTKWSSSENVKWKVKLPGRGSGTPIVWGDQIFIQTAIPTGKKIAVVPTALPGPVLAAQQQGEGNRPRRGGGGGGRGEKKPTEEHQFVLLSIDRKTGKTLWQQTAREEVPHEGHHQDHYYSSASAVTDGEQVFAYFGSRGLYAYDMKGKLQWSKDFGDMTTRNNFGEGTSPALHGDTIVVNWDHEGEDFVVALNKKTGKELWRQGRDELTSWSTPLIVKHDGQEQVIVAASKNVRSYDLKSGKTLWECSGLTGNVIPTPIYHEGIVYVTSGFRGAALLAIRLGRSGNLDDTDSIVWKHNKGTPYVPTPVLYDGKLFFSASNNSILSCFDAKTGKALFEEERLEGVQGVYASLSAANDRIYVVGRNGTTAVLKNSDKLEILATNELGEKIDASPALVGKELFLRGHEHLYCIAN